MRTWRRRALITLAAAVPALASIPIFLLGTAGPAAALDNGLARTPPMGFNNWNSTRCKADFNESMVKSIADIFGCWFRWVVLGQYPNRKAGTVVLVGTK